MLCGEPREDYKKKKKKKSISADFPGGPVAKTARSTKIPGQRTRYHTPQLNIPYAARKMEMPPAAAKT